MKRFMMELNVFFIKKWWSENRRQLSQIQNTNFSQWYFFMVSIPICKVFESEMWRCRFVCIQICNTRITRMNLNATMPHSPSKLGYSALILIIYGKTCNFIHTKNLTYLKHFTIIIFNELNCLCLYVGQ